MTPSDFYALLHSIQSSEIEVYHQGQAEYANDPDNIFANFDRISTQLGLTREQVLLVYALKHWDGIVSYVNGHRSQREDIRGRIKDLRMYLALLWGMVDDGSETETLANRKRIDRLHQEHPSTFIYEEFPKDWPHDDTCEKTKTIIESRSNPTIMPGAWMFQSCTCEEHKCDPSEGCGVEQKPEEVIVNISKILSIDQDGLTAKLRVLVGIEDFSVCFDALTSGKLLRFQVDRSTWFCATITGLNRLESESLILDLIAKGRLDTLISGSSKGEGVEYTSRYRDDCIGEETDRPTWGYGSEEEKS